MFLCFSRAPFRSGAPWQPPVCSAAHKHPTWYPPPGCPRLTPPGAQAEANGFSDEQIAEFREAFSLFDRDADGKLQNTELGPFLRALGRNPTEAHVKSLHARSGTHSLPDCLAILARMPAVDPAVLEKDLRAAFRVFDKDGSGRIPAVELRHIVTSLGERLSEAEADDMLKQADPSGSGTVDYERFIQTILSA